VEGFKKCTRLRKNLARFNGALDEVEVLLSTSYKVSRMLFVETNQYDCSF
jgi:hypothetical protein